MARNIRNYPKSDTQALQDTVQKLRSQVRKLRKENRELREERDTLLDAWCKTENFLQDLTENMSLQDMLEHAKLITNKDVK